MRTAVIDIGTNTILLLVADADGEGGIVRVTDEQVIARLGKGVDASRNILPETIDRCIGFLNEYLRRIEFLKTEHIVVTGSSALRDARNRGEFLARVKNECGIEIEILSGVEEARWSYTGAVSGFVRASTRYAVLDIGGGSTELALGTGPDVLNSASIDIGAVRLTERFFKSSPPAEKDIELCAGHIDEAIGALPLFDAHEVCFVGVAGTVTTLAALELELKAYNSDAIAGFPLNRGSVRYWLSVISRLGLKELREIMRIDPGRTDVILAGILILNRMMERRGVETCVVSERGLRYGIALRELHRSIDR